MSINEQEILERLLAETGYSVKNLGAMPAISSKTSVNVYRVLFDCIAEVEDPGLRWMLLSKFHGPGVRAFLEDLLALLPSETDAMNESSIYHAIGYAVNSRNAGRIWELIENNKLTEGYLIFAKRMLKVKSVRDRVISRLLLYAESGGHSENIMLGLANSPIDSIAEAARRVLGPHPELRYSTRAKPRSGRRWRDAFTSTAAAAESNEIQSFNCDLVTVLEDLRAECPRAFEVIEKSQITLDDIASIPTGRMGTVPGLPGIAFHRIDESELHVFIYDRIPHRTPARNSKP